LAPCANYVDDYPMMMPEELAQSTMAIAVDLLSILGWEVKEPEALTPEASFKALGVIVDLSGVESSGTIVVANKPERVQDDRATLARILASGRSSPTEARKLRGRLQYACSQTFGRSGAFAARLLRDLASGSGGERRLNQDEMIAIRWWHDYLEVAKPRRVHLSPSRPPVLLLTDGAVEDFSSIGEVIIDPGSGLIEFFGERVPAAVEQSWGRGCGRDQVIGQAEIAPLVVSAILWSEVIKERQVIAVVDNDSAKDAAIRGYSPSLPSAFLVAALWKAVAAANAIPWFDRVPGPSNIADGPSRFTSRQ